MPRVLRVYCGTSVFGGCFDEEFAEASNALMDLFRRETHRVVVSRLTLVELAGAPDRVQAILNGMPRRIVSILPISQEALELRKAYLEAGVVEVSSRRDALHIAAATVARVDLIVSWNFKHIVNFERISGYHGVNRIHGLP